MADFYYKCTDVWEAMLRDCAAATQSIFIDQYIVMSDQVGSSLLALLRDKARAGVKIELLFDGVGSRDVIGHPVIGEIRALGGRVRFYNRITLRKIFMPQLWFPRNHAKVMAVDAKIVHIGSACMADDMADWQEAHIRLTEPIEGIGDEFEYRPEKKEGRGLYRYLLSRPGRRNVIYGEMLQRIKSAKKSVWLATPYFTPPVILQHALRTALRRGIDVRLMVGERSDVPIASVVGQTYFNKFLKRGARIFRYLPSNMHAKYMLVDGTWAMIGSANLDYLSLLRNREATLCIEDRAAVAELAAHFEEDCRACRELDKHFWREVPLFFKIIGYLGRGMKKVL